MAQQNFRSIVVREQTYEALKSLGGTVTESIDSVISKLIRNQNQNVRERRLA